MNVKEMNLRYRLSVLPDHYNEGAGLLEIKVMVDPAMYYIVSPSLTFQYRYTADSYGPLGLRAEIAELSDLGILDNVGKYIAATQVSAGLIPTPHELCNRLAELGAIRVEWDERESAWIPIDELKGEEFATWVDDHMSYGYGWSLAHVLATNEIEARGMLLPLMYQRSLEQDCLERWQRWVDAGFPVIADEYLKRPEVAILPF